MGIKHCKILDFILGGIGIPDAFDVPDDVTENRVHQACRLVAANALDEFHPLIHRGGVGNAFQEENLIEGDAEGVFDVDLGLGKIPVGEPIQNPVESVLPAENTVDELVQKPFVQVGELTGTKLAIKHFVEVRVGAFDAVEDFDCRSAGPAVEALPLGCRDVIHERYSGKGRAEDTG
jgi:hypothetical protein